MPGALSKRFCLSEASSIACSFEHYRSSFTREALTFSLWFFSLLRQGKRERTGIIKQKKFFRASLPRRINKQTKQ